MGLIVESLAPKLALINHGHRLIAWSTNLFTIFDNSRAHRKHFGHSTINLKTAQTFNWCNSKFSGGLAAVYTSKKTNKIHSATNLTEQERFLLSNDVKGGTKQVEFWWCTSWVRAPQCKLARVMALPTWVFKRERNHIHIGPKKVAQTGSSLLINRSASEW